MAGISSILRARAPFWPALFAGSLCALLISSPVHSAPSFRDPLDTPADMRTNPSKRPLMAVAQAGERLVAVGPRGLIVMSDDSGKTWTQAKVPVQSDLLAVHFPVPQQGWAVGHEGIVLHSADGGSTWVKQLDGRTALEAFKTHYARMTPGAEVDAASAQLDANYRAGPALPWLDVWFEDANTGYAVGSFGMLMATRDGGKSWEPWLERIDNPENLNLNAIRAIGSELYIVGERGRIYHFSRNTGRFAAVETGYNGSLFGVVGKGSVLVAFGLRGVVYRSDDKGTSWRALRPVSEQTIVGGFPVDGAFVLGTVAGQLLRGDWSRDALAVATADQALRMTGMTALPNGRLVLTGLEGVRIQASDADARSK